MRILLMADNLVGEQISSWLIHHYLDDLCLVVTLEHNKIYSLFKKAGVQCIKFESVEQICKIIKSSETEIDYGILAWWPTLIPEHLLSLTNKGFLNTHPSLLPHNRGKHYNFWAIVEEVPFGVSIHKVTGGIDDGDIISQREIPYDWEDTGSTLFHKAKDTMIDLFIDTYPKLQSNQLQAIKQDLTKGSLHYSSELNKVSQLNIDERYKARDLFNLLRARTFPGHPACSFVDDGTEYEIRVNISRKT